jgi:hypothetical protein
VDEVNILIFIWNRYYQGLCKLKIFEEQLNKTHDLLCKENKIIEFACLSDFIKYTEEHKDIEQRFMRNGEEELTVNDIVKGKPKRRTLEAILLSKKKRIKRYKKM